MYVRLYVKRPLFFSDFNRCWNASTNFSKNPKREIPRKLSSGSGACPCRYTGISMLLIAFRNCFENILKNRRISLFFTANDCPFIAKYKKPHKSVPCHRRTIKQSAIGHRWGSDTLQGTAIFAIHIRCSLY